MSWLAATSPSPHDSFEFQALLGYLAAKAPEVRLGVGVTEPIRRHRITLAQTMLTLAHLSRRPPILGIGSGQRLNTEPYGLESSHPVGRLEEGLRIIRQAFTSREPFDFHGEHFRLERAALELQAPEGCTPKIWIAGHGPRMLRLTGRYGDGWYPVYASSPEDYAHSLGVIRAAATGAGRDPDAITPSMHPMIVVAPTEEEARGLLATKAVRFLALLFADEVWRLFGLVHPLGEGFRGHLDIPPERYDRRTVDDAIAAVPPEMLEGLLWGTPEQVVSKLQAFGGAGLRHVVPVIASATVSWEAVQYGMRAIAHIAEELRSG